MLPGLCFSAPHILLTMCSMGSCIMALGGHVMHRWPRCLFSCWRCRQVSLVTPWRALPAAGQQVFIDYGDKSNEQLLLLYGALADWQFWSH